MTKTSRRTTISFIVVTLFATTIECGAQLANTGTKTLVLGVVFQGPAQPIEEHFRPLVEYTAHRLSPTGQTRGTVVIAPTAGELTELIDEKRIDFYIESAYPTYLINRPGAGKLLLRAWKGGLSEYRSLIFTRKDSGIAQLKDLRGKIVAFEDPDPRPAIFYPKFFC